jgi:predicted DNA-binding ribbon-helix-helix protein
MAIKKLLRMTVSQAELIDVINKTDPDSLQRVLENITARAIEGVVDLGLKPIYDHAIGIQINEAIEANVNKLCKLYQVTPVIVWAKVLTALESANPNKVAHYKENQRLNSKIAATSMAMHASAAAFFKQMAAQRGLTHGELLNEVFEKHHHSLGDSHWLGAGVKVIMEVPANVYNRMESVASLYNITVGALVDQLVDPRLPVWYRSSNLMHDLKELAGELAVRNMGLLSKDGKIVSKVLTVKPATVEKLRVVDGIFDYSVLSYNFEQVELGHLGILGKRLETLSYSVGKSEYNTFKARSQELGVSLSKMLNACVLTELQGFENG